MGETLIIELLIMLVFTVVCALVGQARGRSVVAWAILGFFFGCFALILLLVLPDLKQIHAREGRLRQQNRRLREEQRRDRRQADARYDEHNERLRVHDLSLGMDTRPPQLQALEDDSREWKQVTSPPAGIEGDGTEWFYATDGQQEGPIAYGAMRSLWRAQHITIETLVWSQGMDDWARIGDLAELLEHLDG